jgi:hypothetical protein
MDRFNHSVNSDGAYVVDTREVVSGPPVGTVTFDDRISADIPHCTG